MGFGKYRDLTYLEVQQEHPNYCEWAQRTVQEEADTSPELMTFVVWLMQGDEEAPEEAPEEYRMTDEEGDWTQAEEDEEL